LDDFKIATIFHSDEKVQSVIWINKKIFEVPEKEFNLYTTSILKHLLDSIGAEKSSIRNYLGFDRDMWNEELENLILPDFYFPVSNTDEVFNKINLKEM
jgi:hypothetical protein